MSMPFRNIGKVPPIYPALSIISIFDRVADAEAALKDLDEGGFGDEVVYARGEEAQKLARAKTRGLLAHVYRAMQAVMSDELAVIKLYEKKIEDGSSFIFVPLSETDDVDQVAAILKAHNVTLATYLGRGSFQDL